MLRNLLKPKWIALTLFLLLVIYVFINLSEWQFNRNFQKQSINSAISSELMKPEIEILNVEDLDNLKEWQKVKLKVDIESSQLQIVRKRYLEDKLGFYVVGSSKTENFKNIVINFGWIPIADQANQNPEIPNLSGTYEISGWLRIFEKHKPTPSDYPPLQIATISKENFKNISNNFYIQAKELNPKFGEIRQLGEPKLSAGPHLSYAIQWILFALLVPIGWFILLRSENK